jgi:hypothetical protein
MYDFNEADDQYGIHIQDTKLAPLAHTGTTLWCTLTWKYTPKELRDEDVPTQYIQPLMLNTARQYQTTLTPFVGWWLSSQDHRHHSHIHIALHSTQPLTPQNVLDEWIHIGEQLAANRGRKPRWGNKPCDTSKKHNKIVPFDFTQQGLSYIYGKHMRRSQPFFEVPFTPPKDHRTGNNRKPVQKWERFVGKQQAHNPHKHFEPRIIKRAK